MSDNDDDRRQRQMDFILEQQAQLTATVQRTAERQESFERRQESMAERQDDHEERIARFERSYTAIADLLQRHDSQLVILTENANHTNEAIAGLAVGIAELSRTVERYIKARGNGSNGSNG